MLKIEKTVRILSKNKMISSDAQSRHGYKTTLLENNDITDTAV